MSQSLNARPGFRSEMNALTKAVCDLRERFKLNGVVLVTFDDDRYGTCSSGNGKVWGAEMDTLATKVLTALDDGQFDPAEPGK